MRDSARDWSFLVDCGMQQGESSEEQWNACDWPFDPAKLKFVVLTHAHLDHCGLLPVLYKRGFSGPVYCTRETRDLAILLLKDAAGFPRAAFEVKDVDLIKWHEPQSIPLLGTYHPVGDDLFLRFFRAGHVMGAVSVSVYWGPRSAQKSIAFSGDLGPSYEDSEHLPFIRFNMQPKPCDFSVIESTYGSVVRSPDDRNAEIRRDRLRDLIEVTIKRRGVLVLPAFSLGRTQDVLFDLHWLVAENPDRYASVSYLLDSPLAVRMHPVILDGLSRTESNGGHGKVRSLWMGKQLFRSLGLDDKDQDHVQRGIQIATMTLGLAKSPSNNDAALGNDVARAWRPIMRTVTSCRERGVQNPPIATVVVLSSGTCDGGAAAAWLPKLLGSENTTVALTGYCSPSTIGGKLLRVKDTPLHERVRLTEKLEWSDENTFPMSGIRAQVTALTGYSAHADQEGLLDWLFKYHESQWKLAGRTVFVQHGANFQREALESAAMAKAESIGKAISLIRPDSPDCWFDLDRGGEAVAHEEKRRRLLQERHRIERELEEAGV